MADQYFILQNPEDLTPVVSSLPEGVTLLIGPEGNENRMVGLSLELIHQVRRLAGVHQVPLLIEADGSRQKPLKAPAEHEPVVPDFIDTTVVVAGLSGVGELLNEENTHRPERFSKVSGLGMGERISPEDVVMVLLHPQGGLKGIPKDAKRLVLLNQADDLSQQALGKRMAKPLLESYYSVLVSNLRTEENEVSAVHKKVAGVILAAGGSARMGQPKQLLNWRGKTFVRAVAETAIQAGLDPVVVVTGAFKKEVEEAVKGISVNLVYNQDWKKGQSSSVKAGLRALPENAAAALFFLVDQPQVPVTLVKALVEKYTVTSAPIVAPMIDHHRGNPVLFDRKTFPDFIMLEGDKGGRELFSKYHPEWVPWVDDLAGVDVDTSDDYQRLLGYDK
jgi:molybdenum cofactor cytidylyltransferase